MFSNIYAKKTIAKCDYSVQEIEVYMENDMVYMEGGVENVDYAKLRMGMKPYAKREKLPLKVCLGDLNTAYKAFDELYHYYKISENFMYDKLIKDPIKHITYAKCTSCNEILWSHDDINDKVLIKFHRCNCSAPRILKDKGVEYRQDFKSYKTFTFAHTDFKNGICLFCFSSSDCKDRNWWYEGDDLSDFNKGPIIINDDELIEILNILERDFGCH